ncbi:hypothetical protein ACVWW4_004620 [Bradyrhizobium sp. LB7.1]
MSSPAWQLCKAEVLIEQQPHIGAVTNRLSRSAA